MIGTVVPTIGRPPEQTQNRYSPTARPVQRSRCVEGLLPQKRQRSRCMCGISGHDSGHGISQTKSK